MLCNHDSLKCVTSTECTRTDNQNYDTFLIFGRKCHKKNHKPNVTPPSTVIAAADNPFLPPLDNNDDNDADLAKLMVKYYGGGKNKVK